MEYRIDDLARAAGTTTRNVRAYQERGLLPPPIRRDGRAAIYDDTHRERLKIIDALLQRGFTTAHIADFITSWETGKDLTEVLGLQHAVMASFSGNETLEVPIPLVEQFLGTEQSGMIERLEKLGLAEVHGETVVFTDQQLVETFVELNSYGYDLPSVVSIYEALADRVDSLARLLIRAAERHIVDRHGKGWLPQSNTEIAETAAMLTQWRELGVRAVHSVLARALDENLQSELGAYLAAAAGESTEADTHHDQV
ncbi:MerR family transcriptional regulator [Skermania sp. ID1734]|uniref:MerR family transcriptional regulator n=1 Tax=Skermania sp. ID1734 TaxID=2597516 RepID=UPI001180DA40|nr:MerR family transcriptional regulator [Skermania sp. ID1734]TSD95357.1 MerR family transcriptional regulator [Skermania sp. ID1734]